MSTSSMGRGAHGVGDLASHDPAPETRHGCMSVDNATCTELLKFLNFVTPAPHWSNRHFRNSDTSVVWVMGRDGLTS